MNTIYLICAVAGGTILVIRIILMAIGLDHGGADIPHDVSLDINSHGISDLNIGHGEGPNLLSFQSIAGFFTMFGLVGMGLLQIHVSDVLSLVGALAAGGFTAWVTGMIFIGMRKFQSEGTLNVQNAIGQIGTVYLTIPETGTGVINVTVQGALRTLDAVSDNGQRVETGKIVKVVGVTAGKILVVAEQATQTK